MKESFCYNSSMSKNIVTGIDIGSHSVKVAIAQTQENGAPLILGLGMAPTYGLKDGYIVNTKEVVRSLKKALSKAEQQANVEVDAAYLAVGGVGLSSIRSHAELAIARADGKINQEDIDRLLKKATEKVKRHLSNRVVLHTIPIKYYVDKEEWVGDPVGLKANKLAADVLIVYVIEPHLDNMYKALDELEIEVLDTLASPIAASLVLLSREQKEVGCALANIGAQTVSLIVYEDSVPISLQVFPMGSSDITNDLALKLQVPLKDAEDLKTGKLRLDIPQKKVDEIISARLKEMFSIIKSHLQEIGRDGLLPAGVVLTGGGVGVAKVKDLARAALRLPSELANLKVPGSTVKDSTWAVAYGLCLYGSGQALEKKARKINGIKQMISNVLKHFIP